jgi:hypothetical protein
VCLACRKAAGESPAIAEGGKEYELKPRVPKEPGSFR